MYVKSLILAGLSIAVSLSSSPSFAVDIPTNPSSTNTSLSSTAAPTPLVRRQRGPNLENLLNLTPDQKTRYQLVRSDFRAKLTALRGSSLPVDQKAVQRKQLSADREKSIEAILNPAQLTQYKKILADRAARRKASAMARLSSSDGQPSTVRPTISTSRSGSGGGPGGRSTEDRIARLNVALNLTSDQESKIRTLLRNAAQQRSRLRQTAGLTAASTTADRAKLRSEYASLRKQTSSQIRDLLTPAQQAKFDAMPMPSVRTAASVVNVNVNNSTATGTTAK